MNEVKRGSARAAFSQKPANSLVDGVGDFLEPLLSNSEFVAHSYRSIVEKHSEYASPMQDAVEFDQVKNLLARLAMKRQPDLRLANLDHRARRQFVKLIAIDNDVLAQIAGLESQFGCDRPRCDEGLPEWRTRCASADPSRAAGNRVDWL